MGYIPPELDPEYKDIVVNSKNVPTVINTLKEGDNLNSTDVDENGNLYPAPKEGDIVQFDGKWGDQVIGRVRLLQYVPSYKTYFADIVPLKETASTNVFKIDRNAKV